jgi:hypothetical protein
MPEITFGSIAVVVLSGAAGGIVNCLLLDLGILTPKTKSVGVVRFLGKIVLGICASALIWGFGAYELPLPKMLATCLLGGIGGGNLIASMLQKKDLDTESTKTQKLFEVSTRLTNLVEELNKKEEGND